MSDKNTISEFLDQFHSIEIENFGLVRFPNVEITAAQKKEVGLKEDADNKTFLRKITWNGVKKLRQKGYFKGFTEEQVIEKLKEEFATFDKTGIHEYLLLVADICRWADERNIMRGWGRGSAASSLTLFALGVTKVDPLRHKLNFQRFVSEARLKPVIKDGVVFVDGQKAPDIDCDISYRRCDEVLNYIAKKYQGRTCKISTQLAFTGKTALKVSLKLYGGYTDDEAQRVSGFIESQFGRVQSLSDARTLNHDIADWINQSDKNKRIYEIAMGMEGLPIGKGVHPSGIVIAYDLLDGSIPTELSKESHDREASMVSSYDMMTMAGLSLKIDCLRVRTLDLVDICAKEVKFNLENFDVDAPEIYEYLRKPSARYKGLFQIEDGTTKEATVKVAPKDIDALAACLAISRPGALKYLDQYAKYSTTGELKTIYPAIDEVLKETGNVLTFQEQITRVGIEVFGLSATDADQLRYAVGKKDRKKMQEWESVLMEKGREKNIPESAISYFWKTCDASADYLFVKSHAASYAYLTAACAFLKSIEPQAFYFAMLKLAKEEADPIGYIKGIIIEASLEGIKILPPDITLSENDFSLQIQEDASKVIRFGLNSIKGISDKSIAAIASLRKKFESKFDIFDSARSGGLDIRLLGTLIASGSLSWNNIPRTKLVLEANIYHALTDLQKAKIKKIAKDYDDDLLITLKSLPEKKDEKGRPIFPERQLDSLRKKVSVFWEIYKQNSQNEELTAYLMERACMGFSYSGNLHNIYKKTFPGLVSLDEAKNRGKKYKESYQKAEEEAKKTGKKFKYPPNEYVNVVAFVTETKSALSQKNGSPYLKIYIEDDSNNSMVMIYGSEKLDLCKSFNGRYPEEDDLVLVQGNMSKDGTSIFADSVIIQKNVVASKKSVVNEVVT